MSTSDLSRREFLEISALAAFTGRSPAGSAPPPEEAGWFDRPMRWAQLTLVEDDPARYDPQFWLDYFKRIHADAACLSAGGCVAYYPTKIRLHYRSAWMGDSDPFGKLVSGCRTLDMIVIARTDPHAAHQDVYDAHPDWIAVDAEGRKRRHWASPDLWDSEIRKINPGARFIPNTGGGALSPLDMKIVGQKADILFADRQGRRGLMAPWANGKNGKEYRAAMGRKPIGGIFSVGLEEPYRWKDSVQGEAEIRIWVADGVANGLRPWFTKFSGVLHDERWLKPVDRKSVV